MGKVADWSNWDSDELIQLLADRSCMSHAMPQLSRAVKTIEEVAEENSQAALQPTEKRQAQPTEPPGDLPISRQGEGTYGTQMARAGILEQ